MRRKSSMTDTGLTKRDKNTLRDEVGKGEDTE